jgi:Peptidase M50B-like
VRSSLGTELDRIGQVQQHLPAAVAVLVGLVALVAAVIPALWRLTVHVSTIAHEGAHATMGSALGRKVNSVRFGADGTGRTAIAGGPKPGSVLIGLVGYLGPSAFGLAAAKLIQVGHSVAVLWLTVLLLACMLAMVRGAFGVIAVVTAGFAVYLIAAYTPVGAQVATAYGVAWFLLLSGIRAIAEDGADAGDARNLRTLTLVPRGFWSSLWLIVSVVTACFGAILLV